MDDFDRMEEDNRTLPLNQTAIPSGFSKPLKNIGEMELEMPFVEKYRPVNVSRGNLLENVLEK